MGDFNCSREAIDSAYILEDPVRACFSVIILHTMPALLPPPSEPLAWESLKRDL